jgi:type IV pilus assembly protein PilA
MIVIAIIAIIAAIAIPNIIAARKAANERAAIANLRSVHTAQTLFRERDHDRNGRHDYAVGMGTLEGLIPGEMLDKSKDKPVSGYMYGLLDDPSENPEFVWMAVAAPYAFGSSGDRQFLIDETGVIRFSTTAIVSPNMSPFPTFATLRQWPPLNQ